jgi:cytochrome c-type biogenesis protein CcmF
VQHLGQALVLLSFVLTVAVAAVALAGAARGRPSLVLASGRGLTAVAWLNAALALILLRSFVLHDFTNRYVASYSDRGMSLFYLVTAFWGGEKGALLFWCVVLSALSAVAVRSLRTRPGGEAGSPFAGWLTAILALAVLFFDVLMVFASNPFEVFLASGPPADGTGMNPLLQNPMMALHPPTQLAGFVAYTLPFAWAAASLLAGRPPGAWYAESRRWTLFAWSLLTAGLAIGSLWAYVELGWGGFWGWDPVENAGLLPWLTGTALLHAGALETRRGMLRRWTVALVMVTFLLTLFSTFLTRSRLIQSLHAFSDSNLTPFFLFYLIGLLVACAGLLVLRWRFLVPRRRLESIWSRETLVVANTVLFGIAGFAVLWGTLLPKLSEAGIVQDSYNVVSAAFHELLGWDVQPLTQAVDVGPDWFNRVLPLAGLPLLALTAIGPLVSFRTGRSPAVRRALGRTVIVAASFAAVVLGLHVVVRSQALGAVLGIPFVNALAEFLRSLTLGSVYGAVAVFLAAWVVAAAVVDTRRAVRARAAVTGRSWAGTAWSLFRDNPARFGGHGIHVGVALTFLGFAGTAARQERKDVPMGIAEGLAVGGAVATFLGIREEMSPEGRYASVQSEILVTDREDSADEEVLDALRTALPGAVSANPSMPPTVTVEFPSRGAASDFLATAFGRTAGSRDFRIERAAPDTREFVLSPRDPAVLSVDPAAIHRLVAGLRALVAGVGPDRLSLRTTPGSPRFVLTASDDRIAEALAAGFDGTPVPYLAARGDPRVPVRISLVPAGMGEILRPEVRRYARAGQQTSEVAIDPGLLSDFYLAAAPARGMDTVQVTAIRNPLMSTLWAGMAVLCIGGLALAGMGGRRKR